MALPSPDLKSTHDTKGGSTHAALAAFQTYGVMAYGVMAYGVMAYVVMAYVVMAYIVMASGRRSTAVAHVPLLPSMRMPARMVYHGQPIT